MEQGVVGPDVNSQAELVEVVLRIEYRGDMGSDLGSQAEPDV